jgi:hypothetical protein
VTDIFNSGCCAFLLGPAACVVLGEEDGAAEVRHGSSPADPHSQVIKEKNLAEDEGNVGDEYLRSGLP